MKNYGALVVLLTLLSGAAVYWYLAKFTSYKQPGYTPIACIEDISPGESCIQKEITERERKILMGDDVFDADGYVRARGSSGYLSLVDSAIAESRRLAKKKLDANIEAQAKRCGGPRRSVIGSIPEFPGRWSAIYALDGGARRMLLSRTDFWSYDGKSAQFGLRLKFSVNGSPAAIVLTRSRDSGPALWDIIWVRSGVRFELSVEDSVADDRPQHYTPGQLIQLAESIDGACHWQREKLPNDDFPVSAGHHLGALGGEL